MILEFDTSDTNDVHPELLNWLRDHLSSLKNRRVLWPAKSIALRDLYGTTQEDFWVCLDEYKTIVPADADLRVDEIMEEVGLNWVMYRIKYLAEAFQSENIPVYQTSEKVVVIVDDANAIMLKMAFLGRAEFKMKVH